MGGWRWWRRRWRFTTGRDRWRRRWVITGREKWRRGCWRRRWKRVKVEVYHGAREVEEVEEEEVCHHGEREV